MKDQHTKIKGYRDLSQQEIDLMNNIKVKAEEVSSLLGTLTEMRAAQKMQLADIAPCAVTPVQLGESNRCIALAKTNLQQGFMWAVRGVALPDSF